MPLAYVIINTVPDKMELVLEEVGKISGAEEAYMLYGIHDIIIKVKAKNIEELKNVILKIRKMENVLSPLILQVEKM
jgi:DNA-binding Lrp family transcriptional regulator